jgi:hypothetical protein
MINFSPFLAESGGLVTTSGLGVSFAGSGFAAQISPRPKKITSELLRQIRIGLLQLDFMVPSNSEKFHPYLSSHALNLQMRTGDM